MRVVAVGVMKAATIVSFPEAMDMMSVALTINAKGPGR